MSQPLPFSCFNFSRLASHYQLPNPGKILFVDHVYHQAFIHKVLTEYLPIRDHILMNPQFYPHMFTNLVAEFINASVVSSVDVQQNCINEYKLSSLHWVHFTEILKESIDEITRRPRKRVKCLLQFFILAVHVLRPPAKCTGQSLTNKTFHDHDRASGLALSGTGPHRNQFSA